MGVEDNGKSRNELMVINQRTRFGQEGGPDPSASAKKKNETQHTASVRLTLRKLGMAKIDITKPITPETVAKAMGYRSAEDLTVIDLCSMMKLQQAMKNWKAMDTLIDHIDGKQVQKVVEAQVSLADLVNKSMDKEYLDQPD